MSKRNIVIIVVVAVIVLFAGTIMFSNIKGTDTAQLKEGYAEIYDIDGAKFFMDKRLLDMATAITQISDDSNLEESSFYLYKNGEDQYILFNMQKIVVLVQKGTTFEFSSAENLEEALKSASICNIWFDKSGKKLEIEKREDTYFAKANAQITITKELYGDFTGRLVITSFNGEEWGIFAGIPGNDFEEISEADLEILETIAGSLTVTKTDSKEGKKETDKPVIEAEDKRIEKNIEGEKQENVIQKVEESSKENVKTAKQDKAVGIGTVNNQKKEKETIGKAYKSDIYSLLNIKEKGILSAFNHETEAYETPMISIQKLYTGRDAEKLIKDNLSEKKYLSPREGSSYHAIVYSLDYTNCIGKPYVNIKLRGLDGDALKYRGIKYTKKTRDIMNSIKANGKVVSNYICYYEVPNGCEEYVLECGDGTIENAKEIMAAYYLIKP